MGLGLILDSTKDGGSDQVSKTGRVKGRKRGPVVRKSKKKSEAKSVGRRIHHHLVLSG